MRTILIIRLQIKGFLQVQPKAAGLGITLSHNNFKFVQTGTNPFTPVFLILVKLEGKVRSIVSFPRLSYYKLCGEKKRPGANWIKKNQVREALKSA